MAMKVAAVQMVSGADVARNLQEARHWTQAAAQAGAQWVVLPEYFCFMGQRDADKLALAERPGQGPIQSALADMARQAGVWLVGGTLPMATEDPLHVANASVVFDPQGRAVSRYDKIHLFRFDNGREAYDEAAVLQAGDTPTAWELPDGEGQPWRVGMSICYDLRFGELYRALAADVLLVPAAFTHTTGQAHWEVLLRARAIENQAYVVASAQGGVHDNGRRTWGHSMVIDPWGEVLAVHADGPGFALAEIDRARLQQVRSQLPALQHRRL
jgi:deaminated glutathione amidase